MKKQFTILLKRVERISGYTRPHLRYYLDDSGCLCFGEREIFFFEGEKELEDKLQEYILDNYQSIV